MAKRFTDTGIWEKEWFMKLSPKHKCLFRYLTERCDPAGVWEPNWHLATIYIGEKVDASDLMVINDQVEKLSNGKIWLIGFIDFQYGKLSDKSPAHIPVFKSIKKNNLTDRVFDRVLHTLMEKEKEKEKEKEEDKEEEKETVKEKDSAPEIISVALEQKQFVKTSTAPKPDRVAITEEILNDEIFVEGLQMAHRGKDIKQAWAECWIHHNAPNGPSPPSDVGWWKQKLNGWLSNKKTENGTSKAVGKKQQHTSTLAASVAETYRDVFTGSKDG